MTITSIDIMLLHAKDPTWRPIVCRVHTSDGIYGDGEAAIAYGKGAPAAFGMMREVATMVIGMDPLDNEVIWDHLYKHTFWAQNGGPIVFAAISAIDIALWDIKGKAFGVPVYRLLGGKRNPSLRCYASQLQVGWNDTYDMAYSPQDYADNARKAVAEGYDAVKVDYFVYDEDGSYIHRNNRQGILSPRYLDMIEARVAATRDAVGSGVDIIVENHSDTDAFSAIQIAKRIEKYNILYYEEPTTPSPKNFREIRDKTSIPLATGERVYSRWQYLPYFENGSLQVIQPDIGNAGGLTEVKKICDMAQTYDVIVQPHICASPFSIAVALQLETAIPNFAIHEQIVVSKHAYNKELCVRDHQPVKGRFTAPEEPGIGNEWSEYALTHCDKVTVDANNK